jgi:hypothetical protein
VFKIEGPAVEDRQVQGAQLVASPVFVVKVTSRRWSLYARILACFQDLW